MSRPGENIYKRKDDRWEGRYLKGHGINRQRVLGYIYGHSRQEVSERLVNVKETKGVITHQK
ncbi:hypothetical protein FACS18949_12930 [Clostridia bacterium]|nr:hypothetical protein FACS189425_04380 [Clostridia bacterium]GHV35285.1 hypothetical protein FACS18949_12930 [Clostridia bacterium]